MKKNLLYLFMLICSVSLFTGCSDDDDNGGGDLAMALQSSVLGTYEGDLRVVLPALQLDNTQKRKIFVKADGQENVQLVLRDFSIEVAGNPVIVGDIDVSGIVLSGDVSNVQLEEKKVTISHPDLGELPVTVSGNVASGKANLSIQVVWNSMDIDVTFAGDRISTEVDDSDYAKSVGAWYARIDLTAIGNLPENFKLTYPTDGVEFNYVGYNKVSIPKFYLSFPGEKSPTRDITVEEMHIDKDAEGNLVLLEVSKTIEDSKKGDVDMKMSGVIKDGVLTLNIELKDDTYNAQYVFVGGVRLTGNDIESMTVAGEGVFVQPEFSGNNATFFVTSGCTNRSFIPTFQISEGATIKLGGEDFVAGTAVDFTQTQTFEIYSQKGSKHTYKISVQEWIETTFAHDMNEWELRNETTSEEDKFQEFYEPAGWATSNEGLRWIKMMYDKLYAKDAPYLVTESDGAARLETVDTKGQPGFGGFIPAIPKVTSGSVFNGSFVVNISNTLKSTRFGESCRKEPKAFSGKYKYQAGTTYYLCADPVKANEVKEDASKTDAPAINAVLFEVDAYAYDYLDGTNLLTSDKIAAIASVKDAGSHESYVDFNVSFEWKEGKSWDASKKYKLAIVYSSSKDGDKFSGAPGSVLYVDDLKVSF